MDPEQLFTLASDFTKQFYTTFDTDRSQLGSFYNERSILSFEQKEKEYYVGRDAIVQKLVSLPMQKVAHAITTTDAQPTLDGGLLIVVNGQLQADSDMKMGFCQTFCLKPGDGGIFVANDIFRLSVHNF